MSREGTLPDRRHPPGAPMAAAAPVERRLRPYQEAALAAVRARLAADGRALLVLPTGAGKTVVFAALAEEYARRGEKTLVLAHREELLQQAMEKVSTWTTCRVALERAEARVGDLVPHDVAVASVQTLAGPKRLARFAAANRYGLVVVDEAHHVTAKTYGRILMAFGGAHVLGVTATPDRLDRRRVGDVFGAPAYAYGLKTAIDDGWLSPIRARQVVLSGLDLSSIRVVAGDYKLDELAAALMREREVMGVAGATKDLAGDRPTLLFGATIAHAQALAGALNRWHAHGETGRAVAMDGTWSRTDRARMLASYEAGDFQHLCGCALFLEGFDCARIACVAMARPTKSRALYAQAIGRGTRLARGKTDLLVLDFTDGSDTHGLVGPLDVLGGEVPLADAVRAIALQALAASHEPANVIELLGLAETEVAEQEAGEEAARRFAAAQRSAADAAAAVAEALRREREIDLWRQAPTADGSAHRALVNEALRFLGARELAGVEPSAAPAATGKQGAAIEKLGLGHLLPATRREAGALMSVLTQRIEAGLCSYRQARVLARHGYPATTTFSEARVILDRIFGGVRGRLEAIR